MDNRRLYVLFECVLLFCLLTELSGVLDLIPTRRYVDEQTVKSSQVKCQQLHPTKPAVPYVKLVAITECFVLHELHVRHHLIQS